MSDLAKMASCRLCIFLVFLAAMAASGCITYVRYDALDEAGKTTFDEIRYIASNKELEEFLDLKPAVREAWLEEFWKKRDPTPDTPVNEFKIEHYKRLSYSEKHFRWSKKPGWKTDRGKVFVRYGPPDSIESRPMGDVSMDGGWYSRPYEKWTYNYIPYVGTDIEYLFVDVYLTGEYVLSGSLSEASNDPAEMVASSRYNLAEGDASNPDIDTLVESAKKGELVQKDYDGVRSTRTGGGEWETKAQGTTITEDSVIDVEQGVDDPFKAAVPITPEGSTLGLTVGVLTFASRGRANMAEFDFVIPNTDLQFEPEEQRFKAEIIISTRLYDSQRALVGGTVRRRFAQEVYEEDTAASDRFFTYIAGAILEAGVYEIEAVAKDVHSERYGYVRETFEVKIIDPHRLSLSSIELASSIREASELSVFVKHGFEVMPNPSGFYRAGGVLSVYYEIYNLQIGGDGKPKLMLQYAVSPRDAPDDVVFKHKFLAPGEGGQDQVQVYRMPLRPDVVRPGEYTLHIRVVDVVAEVELLAHRDFEVVE